MTWDGIYKRSSDSGKESPDVILARIDENIKTLTAGALEVKRKLESHEKEDTQKFDMLNRTIYLAVGGGCVVVFIINWFHH